MSVRVTSVSSVIDSDGAAGTLPAPGAFPQYLISAMFGCAEARVITAVLRGSVPLSAAIRRRNELAAVGFKGACHADGHEVAVFGADELHADG